MCSVNKVIFLAGGLLALSAGAWANESLLEGLGEQAVVTEDKILYGVAFFEGYSPKNAEDMVAQIPGFTLAGESGGRGFSQGRGNLLVDGKRPSTKNSKPSEILARITKESVAHIEVLKNGSSELAGQSGLIVNVITKKKTSFKGSYAAGLRRFHKGATEPAGSVAMEFSRGNWRFTGEAQRSVGGGAWGSKETWLDANENITEFRPEIIRETSLVDHIMLGTSWSDHLGKSFTLTLKGGRTEIDYKERADVFSSANDMDQSIAFVTSKNDNLEYNYELGGDYSFPAFNGQVKLIGLNRFKDNKQTFYSNREEEAGGFSSFSGRLNPEERETILRGLYSFQPTDKQNFEFAIEGAENKLDQSSEFFQDDGEGPVSFGLSGGTRAVKEQRGEMSATYSNQLNKNWKFDASAAMEFVDISIKGAPEQGRSYSEPKGFASLQYSFNDNTRLWVRADQRVGQLNLSDFVRNVNVGDNTSDGGNVKIKPEKTFRLESYLEHRIGKSIIKFGAVKESVSDVKTNILLEDGSFGPGNLEEDFKFFKIETEATVYLDFLGITGGKLDVDLEYRDSDLIDPITGEKRRGDFYASKYYYLTYRHDIPDTNWAYRLWVGKTSREHWYRVDEYATRSPGTTNGFTVIYKDFYGMSVTFNAWNVFGFKSHQQRRFYSPDRLGAYSGGLLNNSSFNTAMSLELSGNF